METYLLLSDQKDIGLECFLGGRNTNSALTYNNRTLEDFHAMSSLVITEVTHCLGATFSQTTNNSTNPLQRSKLHSIPNRPCLAYKDKERERERTEDRKLGLDNGQLGSTVNCLTSTRPFLLAKTQRLCFYFLKGILRSLCM